MAKVLIATVKPFSNQAVEQVKGVFKEAGYEVVVLSKYSEQADLVRAVADVDALIIRSDLVDREVMEAGSKLKIVVRAGAGYDNVDLAAATEKGACSQRHRRPGREPGRPSGSEPPPAESPSGPTS